MSEITLIEIPLPRLGESRKICVNDDWSMDRIQRASEAGVPDEAIFYLDFEVVAYVGLAEGSLRITGIGAHPGVGGWLAGEVGLKRAVWTAEWEQGGRPFRVRTEGATEEEAFERFLRALA